MVHTHFTTCLIYIPSNIRIIMHCLTDVTPTIASILNLSLSKRDGVPIPEIVQEIDKCSKLILVIADGLGLSVYEKYINYFNFGGIVLECKSVCNHTSPAIATILTGIHPKHHSMFEAQDTYRSKGLSIIELASMQGIKSSIIMAKKGASSFQGNIDFVFEMEEDEAIRYDKRVSDALVKAAQLTTLIVVHFRILDRFYHSKGNTEKAVDILSRHLKDIMISLKNTGILICGDHAPHNEEINVVPLIALRTRPNLTCT